jgi:hypothetical protein
MDTLIHLTFSHFYSHFLGAGGIQLDTRVEFESYGAMDGLRGWTMDGDTGLDYGLGHGAGLWTGTRGFYTKNLPLYFHFT